MTCCRATNAVQPHTLIFVPIPSMKLKMLLFTSMGRIIYAALKIVLM